MIMNVGQDKEIYRICVDESKNELKTFLSKKFWVVLSTKFEVMGFWFHNCVKTIQNFV